jgi:hypothetical protein
VSVSSGCHGWAESSGINTDTVFITFVPWHTGEQSIYKLCCTTCGV